MSAERTCCLERIKIVCRGLGGNGLAGEGDGLDNGAGDVDAEI